MIALRVHEILKEQNKTAYWLSKQTGVSQNHIGKICNGDTTMIRFDVLEKICNALDCSINDLFVTDNQQLKRFLAYRELIAKKTTSDT